MSDLDYALEPFFKAATTIGAQADQYEHRIAMIGGLSNPADLTKTHFKRLLEVQPAILSLIASHDALVEALRGARPILLMLIDDEYNVDTWGLKQKLAAIDAALEEAK